MDRKTHVKVAVSINYDRLPQQSGGRIHMRLMRLTYAVNFRWSSAIPARPNEPRQGHPAWHPIAYK